MNEILSITPLLFALVSAVWVYWHFLIGREGEPGAEIEINVDFVGQQKAKWLIEVSAILINRSYVRHKYQDFQLNFPHTIDERIEGNGRFFANAEYIDPRLSFRHSYITFIPAEASFIWGHCKLLFPTKRSRWSWKEKLEVKNTQRLFGVPKTILPPQANSLR